MLWGKLQIDRQPQYMREMKKNSGSGHMFKYNQNLMTVYCKKIFLWEIIK